jgi:hypothetical protein
MSNMLQAMAFWPLLPLMLVTLNGFCTKLGN